MKSNYSITKTAVEECYCELETSICKTHLKTFSIDFYHNFDIITEKKHRLL